VDRLTVPNYGEAREAAYESKIIPSQRAFAEDLWLQMLPSYEPDTSVFEVGFDLSRVRVLQEDRVQMAGRLNTMVAGGWAEVAEARREWGLPVDDSHRVFLRPVNLVAVPAAAPAAAGGDEAAAALATQLGNLVREASALQELVGASSNGNGAGG
jgi:hypothetical protein